jgi:hypothetical protein
LPGSNIQFIYNNLFAVLYDEEKRQDYMLNPFSWFEVPGILASEFKIPINFALQ